MKKILLPIALFLFLSFSSVVEAQTDWTNPINGCVATYLMDESSGSLIDSCGSLDLTAFGTPLYSQTGQFGTSIGFDPTGDDDFFETDTAAFTTIPFSMVAWGNPDDVSNAYNLVWVGDKDTTNDMQGLDMAGQAASDPVRAYSFDDVTPGFKSSNKTSFTANFHHVAGVWATSSSRIVYLDGVAGTEETTTVTPDNEDRTAIGAFRDSTDLGYMKGDIDEVGIFDLALDGTDINDIMDNGLVQVVTGRTRRFF